MPANERMEPPICSDSAGWLGYLLEAHIGLFGARWPWLNTPLRASRALMVVHCQGWMGIQLASPGEVGPSVVVGRDHHGGAQDGGVCCGADAVRDAAGDLRAGANGGAIAAEVNGGQIRRGQDETGDFAVGGAVGVAGYSAGVGFPLGGAGMRMFAGG